MANMKDVTKSVVTGAKATRTAATQAVKGATQAVKDAKQAVTRARVGASNLAFQAAEKISPTTARNKRVTRALVAGGAVAGAAAIAVASLSAARARKSVAEKPRPGQKKR